jgi:energy-coupling factor transporter transmembrane protein EcfT
VNPDPLWVDEEEVWEEKRDTSMDDADPKWARWVFVGGLLAIAGILLYLSIK